ncbi:UDP-N-acetylmuramate--L-alanine ligase [Mesonia aestuariivivens]|uniref:UDP-N-acetylmuramate--L-alanine ligase n=1 Tax=Mesonia aestuariivivens TaxID=2796128 RepID=A0ABS6W436_9FLAO|nr:UDP-N-acetylmuramate--L-alanine ligase [Mesonia aestuariivivens]MBW2962633.1 UDP-N-acetylmuramate--L-alanine ligase [Mesonia aestuariivivens]
MSLFKNIQNIYFIGVGGIGMSALARYFVQQNKQVGGYDKTPSKITKKLAEEGVVVSFTASKDSLPTSFTNKENTLVVYTPAVSQENELFQYFKNNEFEIKKRAEVLGMITKDFPTLAVAGTHGKTTTTAILAHILKQSGVKLTAFLGGISENYHTNFINDGHQAVVVEADEFDRSFLHLHPTIAAITSMDADHLDIYGETEELKRTFLSFAEKVEDKSNFFYKKGLDLKGNSIAVEEEADYKVANVKVQNGSYRFDFVSPQETIKDLEFSLPGKHNLTNAATALAMALKFGVKGELLKNALKSFKGVERRFTYHLKTEAKVLIEDYAHHPEEILAVHQAVREMHAGKKVLAVFQPHLFSRTKDFADDFAASLSKFDEVLLMDIYPARELPIEGVNSQMLLDKILNEKKALVSREKLSENIKASSAEVIVMMGAGDIGNEVETIKVELNRES